MQVSRPNRLQVSMKVTVSGVDAKGVPFKMAVSSKNVSRGGLAFTSDLDLTAGTELEIVVERPPIGGREFPPVFTQGKVVRLVPAADGHGSDVAVELTGPRLRMFSAESS